MNQELRMKMLEIPKGKADIVLDTDTYNEIDDQFALSYLMLSPEEVSVKAIYAAPFFNERSCGPEDGMKKSYEEIMKLLTLLGREDMKENVRKGSRGYLESEELPRISPAAEDLVSRSKDYSADHPLYVIAIGAITNVASAILMDPDIISRIVVVWLGGNSHTWPDTHEFNMYQDVAAARIIFGSGVPLVQLPCMGVVSSFRISEPELEAFLRNRNPLCNYLADHTIEAVREYTDSPVWTRVIWDVTAAGFVICPENFRSELVPSPVPEYDFTYSFEENRPLMRYVYDIRRDELMRDLVGKLTGREKAPGKGSCK